MPTKPKMIIAVSQVSTMATLAKDQAKFFVEHGFDVCILGKADGTEQSVIDEGAKFFNMDFRRSLSLFADFKTLVKLIKFFKREKPDAIQLMTLKPSFLGTMAGRLTGVPVIIRHKWGYLRECNYKGIKRFLLFSADKFSNMLAHRVVAICHKLLEAEVKVGAINPKKAIVFGSGSDNGVDLNRFKKTPELVEKGKQIREKLQIWPTAPVLGTVMRINIEKGITELILAFRQLSEKYPNLRLIIVGEFDIRNLPDRDIIDEIKNNHQIHHVGFQKNIEDYFAAMDIFVMPSYREGFCKSNIEASSMELPVVSTDIIGCSESVKDGVSGILVPSRTVQPLADAIEKLLVDKELAKKLGAQGRQRAENEFDQKFVWHNQLRDICQLLKDKGIQPPVEPETIIGSKCLRCSRG
ncbi:MAG: Glycosyl transferase group 1 [Candidatus Uhrbacteria bacterium GW2011_GWF2_39_13]|uniref:Glycosyl transferase group 1 n=1 Tax=Candidatus Uhrbacteria bacterium GW2011_GWF2_39_13 TaxID=1618995 RepID=A0A0G0MRF2_9BACT|nr:MAG: Glycosyl transferase group 1 [Candidatus Uhrbacteria bacterium GW2011_GWF2_39_13]